MGAVKYEGFMRLIAKRRATQNIKARILTVLPSLQQYCGGFLWVGFTLA
jgi:hypothetical protein